jgi:hypothetical protein
MNMIKKTIQASPKVGKVLLVGAFGLSTLGLTGCSANIDDFVTGITSNVCVFSGGCNGSTRM